MRFHLVGTEHHNGKDSSVKANKMWTFLLVALIILIVKLLTVRMKNDANKKYILTKRRIEPEDMVTFQWI